MLKQSVEFFSCTFLLICIFFADSMYINDIPSNKQSIIFKKNANQIELSKYTNFHNFSFISGQFKIKIAQWDNDSYIDRESNNTMKIYGKNEFNFTLLVGIENLKILEIYGQIITGGLSYFIETNLYEDDFYDFNITLQNEDNNLVLHKKIMFQNTNHQTSQFSTTNTSFVTSDTYLPQGSLNYDYLVLSLLISFSILAIKRKINIQRR